jgi:hypothetical protein
MLTPVSTRRLRRSNTGDTNTLLPLKFHTKLILYICLKLPILCLVSDSGEG